MSREFERLLSALDAVDETEPRPPFEDRLWNDLQTTLSRSSTKSLPPLLSEPEESDDTEATVIDLTTMTPTRDRRESGPVGAVLLLVAAAAILVMVIVLPTDRTTEDVTTGGTTSTISIDEPMTPQDACRIYRESGSSLDALPDAAGLDIATLDAAQEELARLQSRLESSESLTDLQSLQLQSVRNQLGQARLEVDQGLIAQAGRTLARAQSEVLSVFDDTDLACVPVPTDR